MSNLLNLNKFNEWIFALTNISDRNSNGVFQDIFINFKSTEESQNERILSLVTSFIKSQIVKKLEDKIMIEFAFRCYYKMLHVMQKGDAVFLPQIPNIPVEYQPFILHNILHYKLLPNVDLKSLSISILLESIKRDSNHIVQALSCANIFFSSTSTNVECIEISLDHIYICLQCQTIGTRDAALTFFQNWAQYPKTRSYEIFSFVSNSWPWSNKNKFYILAALLESNKLKELVKNDPQFDIEKFLGGVRLSLKYKNLFSSGQALVRALSQQNLAEFDAFLVNIIQTGQKDELLNFNSQWARYLHKDQIFNEFFHQNIEEILYNSSDSSNFRLIIFCSIFQQQLCRTFYFEKTILKYFLDSWNTFEISIQFYVYKIITECFLNSVGNFNELLHFFIKFTKTNLYVPCSDFRNTILNRFPLIFNILAKKNVKIENKEHIMEFFRQLKQVFEVGIANKDYQSLIFSLKMFNILYKFFRNNRRLIKNAKISLNEKLDEELKTSKVWTIEESSAEIFRLLEESSEFDDVRELIVNILINLNMDDCYAESLANCMKCNSDSDIDICCRSVCYAKICVHQGLRNKDPEEFANFFYKSCYSNIVSIMENYKLDPLTSCKNGNNLFGWLNSLNELFQNDVIAKVVNNSEMYTQSVITAHQVVDMILALLSTAGNNPNDEAPSFQIMDESLEILISKSEMVSIDHAVNRKYLLLSFWLTLKASCDLTSSIGIRLVKRGINNGDILNLEKCLNLSITVLHLCRHKGAIESAGVSLGKLVREITTTCNENSKSYKLLYSCFFVLFGSVRGISLTRRGAGLTIMFHHLIKNDIHKGRPLLQHAMGTLLNYTKDSKQTDSVMKNDEQHENFHALVLHYLCVLIRDSDLKCNLAEYYDEIMMAALTRIEENEWTIKNAALQLFGALTPKIVGQRQANDSDEIIAWNSTETTFSEVYIKFPKTMNHILESCSAASGRSLPISSIILFLEFLSNIEYIDKNNQSTNEVLLNFRNLFWFFLSFEHEQVRNLSAKCLARFHEFRVEIPELLFRSVEIFFQTQNENFRHGLVLSFIQCIQKFNYESNCINFGQFDFLKCFRKYFYEKYSFKKFSYIVRLQIIDFFKLAQFDFDNEIVIELLVGKKGTTRNFVMKTISQTNDDFRDFGFELFKLKILEIYEE